MNPHARPFATTTPQDRSLGDEESFVTDYRTAVRPSQVVEQKLTEIMQAKPLPLSQLEAYRLPNAR